LAFLQSFGFTPANSVVDGGMVDPFSVFMDSVGEHGGRGSEKDKRELHETV
jgi:hypothetical protein